MKFTADFETTTNPNDCRVWAVGICDIDDPNKFYCYNTIDALFRFMQYRPGSTYYFHNLKFDGEFVLDYLFKHGFTHTKNREPKEKEFTTLISDRGVWYSITICFDADCTVYIYDSLKILTMSVEKVAKAFNLDIRKGEIDYDVPRKRFHKLTNEEYLYVKNDVEIMARALQVMFKNGHTKMTQGSNAMADYKRRITYKRFERYFPIPEYDKEVRDAYKGAFTYCNPKFRGKDVGAGIVLDINSLYPWVMREKMLPYKEGKHFDGQYIKDGDYPLYTQYIDCCFKLKEGFLPTIQLKNSLSFNPVEYVEYSGEEPITMCMTNVDLDIFFKHYDVWDIHYHGGWKFQASNSMFKIFVDYWTEQKIKASEEGNIGMRLISKINMNSLYGKFALNPNVCSKIPVFMDGQVKYIRGEQETRDPIYIPVGAFITAYARATTITAAQSQYDRFIYADTDSLHMVGTDLPDNLDIHQTRLGAWKHEGTFTRARFIRSKTYIEEMDGELHITCAGMPKRCHKYVTWDNFKEGSVFPGKFQFSHVPGGIVLKDIDFTIK